MEPQFIIIDDIYYYNAEELKEFDITFFEKTNKTIRKIIKIKNIPEEEYNYFCFNKKDNKWKISNKNKPSPKAKLFITEKWSKQNIPKFNNELTNNYEEAPDILELNDNEKFKDVDNNPLNIEVRGERNVNKCFFKLKDIIINFNMNRLKDTIEDKNTEYQEDKHYKYFISKNKYKKTSKKELYLTYLGFVRVLFVSKYKIKKETYLTVMNWINQFSKINEKEFKINFKTKKQIKEGYVYCVSSPQLNAIKIGFWRSSIPSLKRRYITSYGENIELYTFYSNNAIKLEKIVFEYFKNNKITNELYQKKYLTNYIKYIQKNNIFSQ